MARINQFQANIAVYNPAAGLTANYVASLNNANANVTIGYVNSSQGNVVVTANTNATSNTTGAVTVAGGASLANGNVTVGGSINCLNGPFITASYGPNVGGVLNMLPGDIIFASSDVNSSGNFPNVAFGATFTISATTGPNVFVGGGGQTAAQLPPGTYIWFGAGNPGNNGSGLYRRIS